MFHASQAYACVYGGVESKFVNILVDALHLSNVLHFWLCIHCKNIFKMRCVIQDQECQGHVRYYLQDVLYLYGFYKKNHLLKMSHCLVMCMIDGFKQQTENLYCFANFSNFRSYLLPN